ncbi:acetoacetate-CoA ligase [Pyrenochaeta sp. DS3sAY3a]|nr:acetoacetate-CoA ligase [Pyrenochaeta sp. DS3sAY3a]
MAHTSHPSISSLTRLDALRRHVNRQYQLVLENYFQLHAWSVDNIEAFNEQIWSFCGIISSKPYQHVGIGLGQMWPRPQWFPGARLNFAENLIHVGLAAHPDAVAVSACREGMTQWRNLTWRQLEQETARYASALRMAGVAEGDRVAVLLTNSIEALLVMLATTSIGAIFSSTAPEMGATGIIERYTQIKPKVLFVECEIKYGGKRIDLEPKLNAAIAGMKTQGFKADKIVLVNGKPWGDESFSGTTGPPKCICHSAGGALLKHKVDLALSMDVGIDSTFYQYSTTGWMMWNVLVGSLCVGAKVVLYDGSPLYPSPAAQLRLLDEQDVTHWGTSPKFLLAMMKNLKGPPPKLDSLQVVVTAGAMLPIEVCNWLQSTVPPRVMLNNGSGGTDMLGCIVGANTMLSAFENELAAPTLGMDVQVWGDSGHPVRTSNEKGELIIAKPFVSMPSGFWGNDGEEEYRKAYFDKFPGVWAHGDLISQNSETQGYTIHGRSDGVLNPGGVRFGTAELYNIVDRFSYVEDCLAVGQRRPEDTDEQVLLFIKMKGGFQLSDTLRSEICSRIRTSLSPRHVPAFVLQVTDVPYTLNGKRIEHVVKSIVSRETPRVGNSVLNQDCLDEYVQFQKLPVVGEKAKL